MLHFFLRKEPAYFQRFIGATLLITGCCIGAGMLGLPVLTAPGGFLPALAGLIFAWGFLLTTGLLLVEVTLWFGSDVHLLTMAENTLGKAGKWTACITFLFLFYCALVAYMTASGELVTDGLKQWLGVSFSRPVGIMLFVGLMAPWLYLGTAAVEQCNRILVLGLFIAYILLLTLAIPHIKENALMRADWSYALYALPALVFSFGYHNLVPSIAAYLHYDRKAIVSAIVLGSLIPLIVYILWEALTLGLIPLSGAEGFTEALQHGNSATHLLQKVSDSAWLTIFAQSFAFCAIVTSFLGVSLSFVDFVADGLNMKKRGKQGFMILGLVLGPPFVFSLLYPDVFLMALNYASAFGAVILFGILPACMVLQGRFLHAKDVPPIVPGGKLPLFIVIAISCFIALLQLYRDWIAQ